MPDAIDSLPCSDIACARDGHKRCRDVEIERGAERLTRAVREYGVSMAEIGAHLERCREEGRDE